MCVESLANGRCVPGIAIFDRRIVLQSEKAGKIPQKTKESAFTGYLSRDHPPSGFGMTAPQSLQVRCVSLLKNRFMTGGNWLTMSSSSKRSS